MDRLLILLYAEAMVKKQGRLPSKMNQVKPIFVYNQRRL
jgi:hypothetical protein